MPSSVGVVGACKTSFVLALGAKEAVASVTNAYLWPRPGGNGRKTMVHILRGREEVPDDDDDGVFVLLFDLTRRESLAAVIAQWAHLSDAPGRRLLLVGTHADCTSQREVSAAEVREISGEFHAYEEVCCHSGDEGILRVQLLLAQWTSAGPDVMASDIPLARASICGYPRPVVTMMSSTSHSLPASPAGQQRPRMRADVWLYDPAEQASSSAVTTSVGGDVKLRTISKAIYDIRGAVAEKSRSLAKYRDRQMSHWLTRSRYFGPTESSRHKRWQEEQKKRQQQQQQQTHGHHHYHAGHLRCQSSALDGLQQQRVRSVSHPEKVQPPSRKPTTRHNTAHLSSSSSSENEESPGTPLERKSFMQPTELVKQRQRQLEADAARQHRKQVAQRAMRMQRRAASNDLYERSTASAAAFESYLNCYDEMDMPPQLQPVSPSLDGRTPSSIPSPASSVASSTGSRRQKSSVGGEHYQTFDEDAFASTEAHCSLELLSAGAEQVGCLPTPLPTTHLQSPVPPMMSPSPPSSVRSNYSSSSLNSAEEALLSDTVLTLATPDKPNADSKTPQPSSVRSHHSSSSLDCAEEALLSNTVLKLPTPDKPSAEPKSSQPSPASATDNAVAKHTQPATSHPENPIVSRTNTMCSSSSENFDCSDIDDMLEYFEGVTLPI
ncbi:hypothetical protein PRIC2_002286 [Phytophthora ramorum]